MSELKYVRKRRKNTGDGTDGGITLMVLGDVHIWKFDQHIT